MQLLERAAQVDKGERGGRIKDGLGQRGEPLAAGKIDLGERGARAKDAHGQCCQALAPA